MKSAAEAIDGILQAARLCKPAVRFDPPEPQMVELEGKQVVVAYIPPNGGVILLNNGCATVTQDGTQHSVVRPTHAGMLLFGYDPQQFLIQAEIICILYRDTSGKQRYADRRILQGTITQQIDQAEAFFKQYVPVPARMEGFHRIDEPDYPIDALPEAVVNAVVHRDYSLQGEAIRIFYSPDRIEIRNPGLLLPGIKLEDLQQGKARSKPRNPILATVLRDFPGGYMERVGSGISFMMNQMRALGRPDPQFSEEGEFIVTFWHTPPSESSKTTSSQAQTTPAPPTRKKRQQVSREQILKKRRQALAPRHLHTRGYQPHPPQT